MRYIGVTSFLLLALSAGASADIIAPASNTWQMDDSVSWALLGADGSVSSSNGVTATLGQNSGSTAVDFSTPVSGAGFLADSSDNGTFTISAWGADNSLLGTESVTGAGSGTFVGLLDNSGADIYSISVNYSGNFSIDTLLLQDTAPNGSGLTTSNVGIPPTPEPSAIILFSSALIGFAFFRRRRLN